MNTWYWEDEKIYTINRDIQNMLDSGKIKTVVNLSLVSTEDPKGSMSLYSAILIYK
jgi:hypothetical protein